MVLNAASMLEESRADTSIKDNLLSSANWRARSVDTVRKCLKSDLFPTFNQ